MKEYIERAAVEKFIEDGLNNPDKNKAFGHDAIEIMAEIHYMPAADVVEVRHGRWETAPCNGVYDMRCSACGFAPGIRFYSSDYCPNCGARMDKEADHD